MFRTNYRGSLQGQFCQTFARAFTRKAHRENLRQEYAMRNRS
jgi:hypothetical protein